MQVRWLVSSGNSLPITVPAEPSSGVYLSIMCADIAVYWNASVLDRNSKSSSAFQSAYHKH